MISEDNKDDNLNTQSENEKMVDEVAKILYETAVDRVRKHVSEVDLQTDRLTRIFKVAKSESDRSSAVLIFALAEDLMLDAVKRYCNPNIAGGWDELTGGNGLLATANDLITFLFLLRWIKIKVYKDLRLLKNIRNRFAHHAEVDSFEDGKIRSWIAALNANENLFEKEKEEKGLEKPRKFTSRQQFLMRSAMVVGHLVSDLTVMPQAIANRVHPSDVGNQAWEDTPENRKELARTVAVAVHEILADASLSEPEPSP